MSQAAPEGPVAGTTQVSVQGPVAPAVANEVAQLADCSHGMAIRISDNVQRCPHCGAMRFKDGLWAFPHLVDALVRAWKKDEPAAP